MTTGPTGTSCAACSAPLDPAEPGFCPRCGTATPSATRDDWRRVLISSVAAELPAGAPGRVAVENAIRLVVAAGPRASGPRFRAAVEEIRSQAPRTWGRARALVLAMGHPSTLNALGLSRRLRIADARKESTDPTRPREQDPDDREA